MRKIAAVVLAVGGVLILQLGQGGGSDNAGRLLLGSALVFGAVCCEAVYTLVGKKASETIDPVLVAFLAAAIAVPVFVPFAIWQWHEFQPAHVPAAAWLALLWYGAGTLALGSWFWYSGVSKAEGALAAGFMGVMPASALILSHLPLNEPFRAHPPHWLCLRLPQRSAYCLGERKARRLTSVSDQPMSEFSKTRPRPYQLACAGGSDGRLVLSRPRRLNVALNPAITVAKSATAGLLSTHLGGTLRRLTVAAGLLIALFGLALVGP